MKCPRCSTETASSALNCPGCNLPTPKGRNYLKGNLKKSAPVKEPSVKGPKRAIGARAAALIIAGTVILSSVGGFLTFIYLNSDEPEQPGSPYFAVEQLRSRPSNSAGMTVEECLEMEVASSRKKGRLAEAEGWGVKQIEETGLLISFTFEEHDNLQQRAEWIYDFAENKYTPRTDLAASVYK
jgi:hypothetical protein